MANPEAERDSSPPGRARASAGARRESRSRPSAAELALERLTDPVLALDPEWRFTVVNRAAEDALERRREELLGRVAWEAFPELAGSGLHRTLVGAAATGTPARLEDFLPAFGGWVSVHAYPAADGVTVFVEDIGDRKVAETAREESVGELQAERALLLEVVQELPAGIVIVDAATGRTLHVNPLATRLLRDRVRPGATLEEVGAAVAAHHPDGRPCEPKEWLGVDAIGAGPAVHGRELLLDVGEPARRHVVTSAIPLRDLAGRRIAGMVVLRDVTEGQRLAATQEFLGRVAELLSSSLDYRETVQRLAAECAASLAEYCIVHVEERGRIRAVGMSHRDTDREQRLRDLLRRFPVDTTERNPVVVSLRSGAPVLMERVDAPALASLAPAEDQRELLLSLGLASLLIVPLKARGRTLGTITMVRTDDESPYTDLDLPLAEELARRAALAVDNARLYREARRAVESRDQLLGVVSHDLRNALNAGLMNADLLLDIIPAFVPGSAQRRQMEALRRSLGHMHRLVQDLLDVDALDSGRLSLRADVLDLRALAEELADTFGPVARERQIDLSLQMSPDLPRLRGDQDRVRQVFSNLISNALGFTPPGGRVEVGAQGSGDHVVFQVADTGPGIAREELPRVFDRFWKSEHQRSPGSGLGLAIARGLVQAHGGEMWVESEAGHGATLRFTLPRAEPEISG